MSLVHASLSITGGTGRKTFLFFRAASPAFLAYRRFRKKHRACHTENTFLKRDVHVYGNIAPAVLTAPRKTATEKVTEYFSEVNILPAGCVPKATGTGEAATGRGAVKHMPVRVIFGAALVVGKRLVRFVNFLEARLIARLLVVRMIFPCQRMERFFY